jgi:hypothetical protein
MVSTAPASQRPHISGFGLLGFGLVAMVLLLLQVVLSRFFAATLTYYYAFMLVSLAMLGLAGGGLAVRVFPRLFPEDLLWERASVLSLATGVAVLAGALGVLALYPDIRFRPVTYDLLTPWTLAGVFWCCFPAFLLGGIVISGVLSGRREQFHRLYAVDLASAALGCVVGLLLLEGSTPVELLLTFAPIIPMVAAVLFALEGRRVRLSVVAVAVTAAAAVLGSLAARDPARVKPPHLAWTSHSELVSEWNATSAVRVYPWRFFTWALSPTYRGPTFSTLDLIIDGIGGTPIVKFDGRPASLARYEYLDFDLTALPHHLLPRGGRQLIVGPGGGVDILQAVRAGREDVTAVEINPLVARVVNEDLAEFSGSPYRLPGVRTVIENGRTFVKRSGETWDLVTLTWVDTGGSATALAFSENYLYTTEAFQEYLAHLTPGGMFGFLRAWDGSFHVDTMRGVAVAVNALLRNGVADPGAHLLIAASHGPFYWRPMCLVLVRRTPFSTEDVARARRFLEERQFFPVWLPDRSVDVAGLPSAFHVVANVIHGIITSEDRSSFYRQSPFDIAPSTDDNPFYFVERAGPRREAGVGVGQLGLYLAILATLVIPFLLAPALALMRRSQRLRRGDLVALGYFALLGVSFMLVEIDFFHIFALLLGKPTLTFSIVLSSLLVSSGLGSLVGGKIADGTKARLAVPFAALTAQLLAFAAFGTTLLDALIGLDLGARIAATLVVVSPIGFCMGIPLASGMRLVREHRDLVLWGWAINGALSVLASVAAIYLAIHQGIARTFALGCAGYVLAGVLILVMKAQAERRT